MVPAEEVWGKLRYVMQVAMWEESATRASSTRPYAFLLGGGQVMQFVSTAHAKAHYYLN